jgi:isoleucyl-tRNA synthetase
LEIGNVAAVFLAGGFELVEAPGVAVESAAHKMSKSKGNVVDPNTVRNTSSQQQSAASSRAASSQQQQQQQQHVVSCLTPSPLARLSSVENNRHHVFTYVGCVGYIGLLSVLLPLPLQVIDEFGADSLRLYIMFMGPVDAVKPWDTSRVSGTTT